ncbi:9465_t:CDS:2, partial [Funneliformis caledonium]
EKRHDDSDLDEESGPRKKEKSLVFSLTLLSPYVKINLHKFYDRDEALNLILDVACLNYEKRTSNDHKDHHFIQVPGGIGIEKTRIGWESQYLLSSLKAENDYTDEFKKALKDPCYIFVDLNNGCKYLMGFDDKKDSSVRIGARMAVASGLVSGRLSDLLDTNTKCLNLFNVISHILKLRLETNQQSVYAIIIHLDEFQLYIDDVQIHQKTSWELARKFYKTMLKEIGSVMRENSNANYFIVPICTGTSAIDINFLLTEHSQISLNLKPLNYESARSMFLDKYEYLRLTRQSIKRDFLLSSGMSIGELERAGLIYLSNFKGEQYTIVMPFILLKILNNILFTSDVETVLIEVKNSMILSIKHKIYHLEVKDKNQTDSYEKSKINAEMKRVTNDFAIQTDKNWQLSDIFRNAKGADTLLQRKVRLRRLKVFTENEKFLVKMSDIAKFTKFVLCDDNVSREFDRGIFRCYQGCANIDHRWILDSADEGKKLAIFSQIKYSERDTTTTISTPVIKRWYDTTIASVENYKTEYDEILVLFTNRTCTGTIDMEQMPKLLLIYP